MADVTAIILTKNEEQNLGDCLDSLAGFCKRVAVVDSGSTDNTRAIAEAAGAEFFVHEFENYARQFNWGIDNCGIDTRWTLRIDADERLTPQLVAELTELTIAHADDDVNGVTMEADLVFLGRRIKHGCRNKRKLMLFKTGIGRIEDRRMDEHTVLKSGVSISARHRFVHHDFKSMTHYIAKMNWYATREMQDYIEFTQGADSAIGNGDTTIAKHRQKKFGVYYRFPMFLRCYLLFIFYYIFRLGFLDGREGYVYNYMYHLWYRTLVDTKILEYKKDPRPFERTGTLNY